MRIPKDWREALYKRFKFFKMWDTETRSWVRKDKGEVWAACGPGWYTILWELGEHIEEELEKMTQEERGSFEIADIKEKFGGLRFYCYGNEAIEKWISKAEDESYKTCEQCGKPGKNKRVNGWIYTVCKKHTPKEKKI
jgi:hypothetical protein